MAKFDYIIIGGGSVGTAALHHLSKRGAGRVLLLEKLGGLGRGATGIWGSLVRMFHHNFDTTLAATQSVPFYVDFERQTGTPFSWNRSGSLYFLKRAALPQYERHLEALERSGLEFSLIEPKQGKRQFSDFAWFEDDVAVYEPHAGVASPKATTEAFTRQAQDRGAECRLNAEVVEIVREGGRVVGVRTRDGGYDECRHLIVCAGIWTNELLGGIGSQVAAYPVPIQLNRFSRHQVQLSHPFFVDVAAGTFGHATPSGSFIGGYAGRELGHAHLESEHPHPDVANRAKHEIARRIPWIKSAALEGGIKALESYAEGNCGFVTRLAGFDNVIVSTGWSCGGFTLAPFIGQKIADIALGTAARA